MGAITAVFFWKNLFPPVDDPPACVEDLAMKLNTKATPAVRYAQLDRFYRRRSEAVRRAIATIAAEMAIGSGIGWCMLWY
jgi:hypothetical protein